jgi:divalent metal cation (Fe/Co/Zn/Cd) transporter
MSAEAAESAVRVRLQRRAIRLEFATIVWNVGEAVFTIGLGLAVGSLALIGFGTDSLIEVFASSVVVWHVRPGDAVDRPDRTRTALRLVAFAYIGLAVVLASASIRDLALGRKAGESVIGIIYLGMTAVVMFSLAVLKHRTATALRSAPLRSEATLTFLDGVLASLTLVGLGLNVLFGWTWADPAAALAVAVMAAAEGRMNLKEAAELVR